MSRLKNDLLIKFKYNWPLILFTLGSVVIFVHLVIYYNYTVLSLDEFKKEKVAPITVSNYIAFRDQKDIAPPARDVIFVNKYYKNKVFWSGRVVTVSQGSIYIDIDFDTRTDLRVDLYIPSTEKSKKVRVGDTIEFVFRPVGCEGCLKYSIDDALISVGGAGWFYPMSVMLFVDFPYDRQEQAKYFTPTLYGTEGIILSINGAK